MQFDGIDSQIVAALQQDGTLTTEALGEQLGLSASQAGRRKARLEKLGMITGYVAKRCKRLGHWRSGIRSGSNGHAQSGPSA